MYYVQYLISSSAMSPSFHGLRDIKVYFMHYFLWLVEKHHKTLRRYTNNNTIICTDDEEGYYKLIDEVHIIFHAA